MTLVSRGSERSEVSRERAQAPGVRAEPDPLEGVLHREQLPRGRGSQHREVRAEGCSSDPEG